MYFAFEGIDTAGKSTQLELLRQKLECLCTKEPGGTDAGSKIRDLVLHQNWCREAEVLLFLADRAQHICDVVEPNINTTILSDRSLVSNIAYAMSNGFNYELLKQLNLFATKRILPNYVFILKLDRDTLTRRLGGKEADTIEKRGISYLLEVQENIIYATQKLQLNHSIIDAGQDIETIHEQILEVIEHDNSA